MCWSKPGSWAEAHCPIQGGERLLTIDLGAALALMGTLLVVSTAIGLALATARRSHKNEIIDGLETLVATLKDTVATQRDTIANMQVELANVRGRLEVLTSDWGKEMMTASVTAASSAAAEAVKSTRMPRRRGDDAGSDFR